MNENKPVKRPVTVLEPIADFDRRLEDNALGGQEAAPLVPPSDQVRRNEPTKQKTAGYRPALRPPMALLQIHDDGGKSHDLGHSATGTTPDPPATL